MRATILVLFVAFLLGCGREERNRATADVNRPSSVRLSPAEAQQLLQRFLQARYPKLRWSGPPGAGDGWQIAVGELAGQPGSVVISSVVDDNLSAVVTSGCPANECRVYSYTGGRFNERILRPEMFGIDAQPLDALPSPAPHVPCTANETEITALILYTETAVNAHGQGKTGLESDIRTAVAAANLSFQASGLTTVTLRPLDIALLGDFFEDIGGNIDVTLRSFAQDSEVKRRREESGADLVILVAGRADACGNAFQMTAANAETFENSAFAVVRWDCLRCRWSLAHEIGHLMGACHERNAKDCPVATNAANFGYQNQPPTKSPLPWVTMMATSNGCATCPRLNQWSTPQLLCSGDATGSKDEDNVSFLATTAPHVAKFRCTQ